MNTQIPENAQQIVRVSLIDLKRLRNRFGSLKASLPSRLHQIRTNAHKNAVAFIDGLPDWTSDYLRCPQVHPFVQMHFNGCIHRALYGSSANLAISLQSA